MQATPLVPDYFNHPRKETPGPLAVTRHLLPTPSPWEPHTHFLCGFVSVSPRLCLFWAQDHTPRGLSRLCSHLASGFQVSPTLQRVSQPHSLVWLSLVPYVESPCFICPLIGGWTWGSFPPLTMGSDAAVITAAQVFMGALLRVGVGRGGAFDL